MEMGFWIKEGRNGQGKALDGVQPLPCTKRERMGGVTRKY